MVLGIASRYRVAVVVGVLLVLLVSLCGLASTQECGSTAKPIAISETIIDATVVQVAWTSTTTVFLVTARGTVYLSKDEGISWNNIMSSLQDSSQPYSRSGATGVSRMQVVNNGNMIWLFGRDRQLWAVSVHDDGEFSVNYYLLQTQDNPNSSWIALVLPHPTNPEWALMLNAYSCAPAIGNCHTELYFTQDLGRSWRLAGSYVFYVAWGQSPSTIITVEYDPKSGDQTRKSPWVAFLVRSDDIGQTRAITRKWITGAYYSNNKLYWAQFDAYGAPTANIYVSHDDLKTAEQLDFHQAANGHLFKFVSTTEGTMVAVEDPNHTFWSTLTVSDETDADYTVSLQRVATGPGYTYLERVQGLNGIYFATQYDTPVLNDMANAWKYKVTVMTFDRGGIWDVIRPPSNDPCPIPDPECRLNLFLGTEFTAGPLYSVPSAVGLLLANGNVGTLWRNATEEVNTYFSRDAGLTWSKIRTGAHVFAFGDMGAITLLVPSNVQTSSMAYSWNQGATFDECSFTSTGAITPQGIAVEPKASSQRFFIYGSRSTGNGVVGVVVSVDFTNFHEAACQGFEQPGTFESDYEFWYPSDGFGDNHCLLGQQVQYIRRKQFKECFNGRDSVTKEIIGRCPCTAADYECDGYCFIREEDGECHNICKSSDNNPWEPPSNCDGTWERTQGYRLISDTMCEPLTGVNLLPTEEPCPGVSLPPAVTPVSSSAVSLPTAVENPTPSDAMLPPAGDDMLSSESVDLPPAHMSEPSLESIPPAVLPTPSDASLPSIGMSTNDVDLPPAIADSPSDSVQLPPAHMSESSSFTFPSLVISPSPVVLPPVGMLSSSMMLPSIVDDSSSAVLPPAGDTDTDGQSMLPPIDMSSSSAVLPPIDMSSSSAVLPPVDMSSSSAVLPPAEDTAETTAVLPPGDSMQAPISLTTNDDGMQYEESSMGNIVETNPSLLSLPPAPQPPPPPPPPPAHEGETDEVDITLSESDDPVALGVGAIVAIALLCGAFLVVITIAVFVVVYRGNASVRGALSPYLPRWMQQQARNTLYSQFDRAATMHSLDTELMHHDGESFVDDDNEAGDSWAAQESGAVPLDLLSDTVPVRR